MWPAHPQYNKFNIFKIYDAYRGFYAFTPLRNMVYPALLPLLPLMRTPRLPVVDWTDAPADLNGLVRFTERRNLVSAHVSPHFKRSLPLTAIFTLEARGLAHNNDCGPLTKRHSEVPVVQNCNYLFLLPRVDCTSSNIQDYDNFFLNMTVHP